MASNDPSISGVLAENLRETRERRGRLSVRALSARMTDVGFPVLATGITRAEAENPAKRRRVTVDELAALALALDTTPWHLLTPKTSDSVAVTPTKTSPGEAVSAWLGGEGALHQLEPDRGDVAAMDEHYSRELGNLRADAPPWAERRYRPGDERLWVIDKMRGLVASELDGAGGGVAPAGRADALRRALEKVTGAVELMADRLDAEGGA